MTLISSYNAATRRADKASRAKLTSDSRSRKRTAKQARRVAKLRARADRQAAQAACQATRQARAEWRRRLQTTVSNGLTRLQPAVTEAWTVVFYAFVLFALNMAEACVVLWRVTCVVVVGCAMCIVAIPDAAHALAEAASLAVEAATYVFAEAVLCLVEVLDFFCVVEVVTWLGKALCFVRRVSSSACDRLYLWLYLWVVDVFAAWAWTWLVGQVRIFAAEAATAACGCRSASARLSRWPSCSSPS